MVNILCFGEPLIRLATKAHERLEMANELEISYSGAELVVAISLAQQGESVHYASKVSNNRLGSNALMRLAHYGVNTSRVLRADGRMGIYFTERGKSIRPTLVTYDRGNTVMARAHHTDFDWDKLLNGIDIFFFSGIIPAISSEMILACKEGLEACKGRGIQTVCDLNYRSTMWKREQAMDCWHQLFPLIDRLVASDDDIIMITGANIFKENVFEYCHGWMNAITHDYPVRSASFIMREVNQHDEASFRGDFIHNGNQYVSRTQFISISDLSSSGSVFAAALLHGIACGWEPQFVIDYATMASASKATFSGDLGFAGESEIASLLAEVAIPTTRQ